MSISIQIGKVSKRRNSTFRPTLTTSVNVLLKDGTSDTAPQFLLAAESAPDVNYAKWGSRYYFVESIIYERNNLYTIICSLDVLATYKDNIASTTAFVAYDTSGNTELVDNRLSVKTTASVSNSGRVDFETLGSGACIIVTLTGRNTSAAYAMDVTTASSLLNSITNWLDQANVLPIPPVQTFPDVMSAIQVLCENLVKVGRQLIATGRAPQSIQSAVAVPYPVGEVFGSSQRVYLGDYDTGISATRVRLTASISDEAAVSIPWQATDWRRNAPYHEIYLYIPYVGVVQLSPSDLIGVNEIWVQAQTHCISGDTIIRVNAAGNVLMHFSVKLATPYAIGSSNVTPMQGAMSVLSAIGGAAAVAGSGGAAAVAAGSGAIAGIMNNMQPTLSTIGGAVGGASILGTLAFAQIITIYHDTNVEPSSVSGAIGTPTMAAKSLGSVSGYCECRCASVSAPAERAVLDQINGYLNSGFFME